MLKFGDVRSENPKKGKGRRVFLEGYRVKPDKAGR
jgi:hypothetical protein